MEVLSNNDKIKRFVTNELVERGWEPVKNHYSGILLKNDCIFMLHLSMVDPVPSFKVDSYGIRDGISVFYYESDRPLARVGARSLVFPKGAGWHVERFGWLLAKGNLNRYIADVYTEGKDVWSDTSKELEEWITEVDSIASMSDVQLRGIKQKEVMVSDSKNVNVAVPTNSRVVDAKYFMSVNRQLDSFFEPERVYLLAQYDNNYYARLLTPSLVGFSNTDPVPVELNVIEMLDDSGALQAVTIGTDTNENLKSEWQYLSGKGSLGLPEEFDVFKLDVKQQSSLSHAFDACYNFTPLLFNGYSDEASSLILSFLEGGYDYRPLINKRFSPEQLRVLLSVANNQYAIDSLANTDYDPEYMQLLFDEMVKGFDRLNFDLRQRGFSSEQIQVIRKVASRKNGFNHVERDLPPLVLRMIDSGKTGGNTDLSNYLLDNGVVSDSNVYAYWYAVDQQVKEWLKNRLCCAKDLTIKGVMWKDWVSEFLDKARYVEYADGNGFSITGTSISVIWDYNSFAICSIDRTPIWRAVLVNDRYYVNRRNEDDI